ncbi:4455_t:CDS:2 [Paraglomus occultum]|uniref:4455_t:CDS:1 n=1 Tax=Paraglomus occultum TaxID=144539 RepID=A0A9N9GJ26_9GLOM|nr:4455_t:CDS:2 [Paraglomus occultum]
MSVMQSILYNRAYTMLKEERTKGGGENKGEVQQSYEIYDATAEGARHDNRQ